MRPVDAPEIVSLKEAVFQQPGFISPSERLAIQRFVLAQMRNQAESHQLPLAVQTYLTKLVRHAYKITDEDMAGLHAAGYDEEAIFELSFIGALAVGFGQLDQAQQAWEDSNAT